jgi:tetratricopeptide (TPR) repeat protein
MACPGENELLDFAEGRAPAAAVEAMHAHLDGCPDCQQIVAALARTSGAPGREPPLLRGETLDRFLVLEELGQGGMGAVYAAFDPELERKIALKVIRPDADGEVADEFRKRLLTEAQAQARLSHPNVVTVHESRAVGSRVFIAMELIAGSTARQYLRDKPLGWRRILELYLGAGEGLAAAHAAGLVHRDFKPDNVLVGDDGRARVTDFGLASLGQAPRTAAIASAAAFPLTQTGTVVGTPAYMAPELWKGEAFDARSDQFSFCVSLYEGLYGSRPFPTGNASELYAALARGLAEAPSGAKVPGHLRKVLARGLSSSPQDRYPTMAALLEALRRDPLTRLRPALVAGAATLLLAIGLLFGHLGRAPEPLCEGAEKHLAGIWDADVKSRVRSALGGTDESFRGVERALDGYTHSWVAMHTEACEATRVRGEQSEAMLDLREACLERRARDVKALVSLFQRRGASAAADAVQAAYALPSLQECADTTQLAAEVKPPADALARTRVAEVDAQLSEVRALASTGKISGAIDQAQHTVSLARDAQHAPTLAEALFQLGVLEEKHGDAPSAEQTFLEAAWAAQAGHADRTAARARIELVRVIGELAGHSDGVPRALSEAQAALARVGSDADLEATLEIAEGSVLSAEDRCEDAMPHLRNALVLADRAWDEGDPRRAQALHALGTSQRCVGDLKGALVSHRAALTLRERTFGKDHPEVADSLNSIANVLFAEQDFAGALPFHERALAIREQSLGPSGAVLAGSVLNVGVDLISLGRNEEGRQHALRALDLYETALGHDSPRLALPLLVLGHVEVDLGMPEEADHRLERALTLLAGRDDEQTAMARFNLARALRKEHKDDDRAHTLALQARRYFERRKDARQTQLEAIDSWLSERHG